MIPELSNFSLMLALCLACVQSVMPITGAFTRNQRWIDIARPAAASQCLFVTLAFVGLLHAFIVNDFSVAYVAANSNSTLPVYYRITAAWGGHEGSLLLWVQILSFWTLAVATLSRQLPDETVARVLSVMGFISIGFLSFMLFTSNPFDRLFPAPQEGRDLNPLLQDFGMIIHPPLLYMGYVGFSVAFAFAVAALLGGKLDAAWARWSRPWTSVAWGFLTLGIFLGSFWAYYELGWGGWWFWDAVENAAFMPWLVGTALIHSLAVTEKRGSFKSWTVLLAIIAFSLSLLGTFLVRSGVLTSVHAFATDPQRGLFILIFLAIVIGSSLTLYAWRAPKIKSSGTFNLFSRESMLLLNNVLLLTAAGTVLLGTLYPLFLDALGIGKISVGPPYFETVLVPIMIPLLSIIAIGPFVPWKNATIKTVLQRLQHVTLSIVAFLIIALMTLRLSIMAIVGLTLAVWILFSTISHLLQRLNLSSTNISLWKRIASQPGSYWGMQVAHAGLAIFIVGVTMVKSTETSTETVLRVGDQLRTGIYNFHFTALNRIQGPNYIAARGTFEVSSGDRKIATLSPERRFYTVQKTPMTEAAIDRGFTRDLYVSLGDITPNGTWIVRVQHKPFVSWIWTGCLMIAFGGFTAALDRRYRITSKKHSSISKNIAKELQPAGSMI